MVYKRIDIYDAKAASISRTRSFNDNISYLAYIIITIELKLSSGNIVRVYLLE